MEMSLEDQYTWRGGVLEPAGKLSLPLNSTQTNTNLQTKHAQNASMCIISATLSLIPHYWQSTEAPPLSRTMWSHASASSVFVDGCLNQVPQTHRAPIWHCLKLHLPSKKQNCHSNYFCYQTFLTQGSTLVALAEGRAR